MGCKVASEGKEAVTTMRRVSMVADDSFASRGEAR
jgi:hypothetical protein